MPSTISRELRRNADRRDGYRATTAHALAYERASRPKPAKLATNPRLRQVVQDDLVRRYSPEQIAGRLRRQFPDEPEMWVSTETIYQSLYVQSRGALRRELTRYLRTGRALRKPGRSAGQRKNRIPDMITRPAPARSRRSRGPGPLGRRPADRQAQPDGDRHARRALHRLRATRAVARRLQARARRARARQQGQDAARDAAPLTDLGPGPRDARLKHVRVDAGIEVYFYDPHAPWQRGSNENTNGLLRQYFPKGKDFSAVTETQLDAVADELNDRPRKRLGFAKPTEQLTELLLQ